MKRAAVYLRYSSDKQRPSSLEDQLRICRRWIDTNGYSLDERFIFQDAALSGQTVAGRSGLEKLIQTICVDVPPVDALVIENTDRLSRSGLIASVLNPHAVGGRARLLASTEPGGLEAIARERSSTVSAEGALRAEANARPEGGLGKKLSKQSAGASTPAARAIRPVFQQISCRSWLGVRPLG